VEREILTLPVSGGRGRMSPRLDAILIADAARERARAVRDLLIALLALLGLPLWVVATWPTRWTPELRILAATIWALAAVGLVVALAREQWWSRVRSHRVAALGPLPMLRAERGGGGACATASEEED
jgi:peptidoglycan/LPS O-acetylase OafA/YrhL